MDIGGGEDNGMGSATGSGDVNIGDGGGFFGGDNGFCDEIRCDAFTDQAGCTNVTSCKWVTYADTYPGSGSGDGGAAASGQIDGSGMDLNGNMGFCDFNLTDNHYDSGSGIGSGLDG